VLAATAVTAEAATAPVAVVGHITAEEAEVVTARVAEAVAEEEAIEIWPRALRSITPVSAMTTILLNLRPKWSLNNQQSLWH